MTCDRVILGIIPHLKNGEVVELYVTHLVDEANMVLAIEYDPHMGGESCPTTFDKELGQDLGKCDNLGFEEGFVKVAAPYKPTVSKNLRGGCTIARGEDLDASDDVSSIGKDLGSYGDVFAIGKELGDGGVATWGENFSGGGSDFFATGGDLGDIGVDVSTIGGDLGDGVVVARGENLGSCGSGFSATCGYLGDNGVAVRGEDLGGTSGSARSDYLGGVNDISITGGSWVLFALVLSRI
ncbi:putative PE-PGRS family protein PE-PGRS54-like [Capsicum galapagoense]